MCAYSPYPKYPQRTQYCVLVHTPDFLVTYFLISVLIPVKEEKKLPQVCNIYEFKEEMIYECQKVLISAVDHKAVAFLNVAEPLTTFYFLFVFK